MADSQAYRRYVVVLLLVVYLFNQMDRAIFGILMEPIKREFGLSDTQLGFVSGPALVVFYATLGIPIARWADRSHRINIMSCAIMLWSGIVMLSAAVSNFWQLTLARIGVGIGEAGFSAIAQSVITDYHAEAERARALSIFMLAIPLGGVASNLVGGWVNEAYGWRAAFIAAGVPGIVLALLMKLTVREPPRERRTPADVAGGQSFKVVIEALWRDPALRHLAIAQGLANIVISGLLGWIGVFFIRTFGMATGELGTWLALIGTVGGSGGIWLGGYLTARYGAHDNRIKLRMVSIATLLIIPATVLVVWAPSKAFALCMQVPANAVMLFFIAPTFAFVQSATVSGMRATMASLFILIQVLGGGIVGLQLMGILSDALTPVAGDNVHALHWSMTLLSLLAAWASLHFWLAGRAVGPRTLRANADE